MSSPSAADVASQVVGFCASFGIFGALAYRYGVLRGGAALGEPFRTTLPRAARIGMVGATLGVFSMGIGIAKRAEAKHTDLPTAITSAGANGALQASLLIGLIVLFAMAARQVRHAWCVAAGLGIAFACRAIGSGRLGGLVNPLHVLGGGIWIGGLFVLAFSGVRTLMQGKETEREAAVANIVRRFSLVALCGASLLVLTGVITAWTHLKRVDALWTTPYGLALIRKLVVVALVAVVGAWNWRRVGPALGREGGARRILRSAFVELALAFVVLVLTGVLVSEPSPKAPRTRDAKVDTTSE